MAAKRRKKEISNLLTSFATSIHVFVHFTFAQIFGRCWPAGSEHLSTRVAHLQAHPCVMSGKNPFFRDIQIAQNGKDSSGRERFLFKAVFGRFQNHPNPCLCRSDIHSFRLSSFQYRDKYRTPTRRRVLTIGHQWTVSDSASAIDGYQRQAQSS